MPSDTILLGNNFYTEFKGALGENFVLQSLIAQFEVIPRYWTSQGKAEIDFLIQNNTYIIPIEVKSSANAASKSLSVYEKTFSPKYRICFSLNNLKKDANMINIPIFLADWTSKLLINIENEEN